jgi:hypothetical protein
MDIHPWTNYEIARMRDEERLARARSHMLVQEARRARRGELEKNEPAKTISWFVRMRRSGVVTDRAPAGSGA